MASLRAQKTPDRMMLSVLTLGSILMIGLLSIVVFAPSSGAPAALPTPIDPLPPLPTVAPSPSVSASVAVIPSVIPSGVSSTTTASRTTAPAPSPKDKTTTAEDQVTTLINAERKKAGCAAVRTDERMRKAARAHSADMAKYNYFSHTGRDGSSFADRLARAGYPKSAAAGENIAYGYATPAAVVNGWMTSKDHRANILNCAAKATAVGLAYRGQTPYWTQELGRQ